MPVLACWQWAALVFTGFLELKPHTNLAFLLLQEHGAASWAGRPAAAAEPEHGAGPCQAPRPLPLLR